MPPLSMVLTVILLMWCRVSTNNSSSCREMCQSLFHQIVDYPSLDFNSSDISCIVIYQQSDAQMHKRGKPKLHTSSSERHLMVTYLLGCGDYRINLPHEPTTRQGSQINDNVSSLNRINLLHKPTTLQEFQINDKVSSLTTSYPKSEGRRAVATKPPDITTQPLEITTTSGDTATKTITKPRGSTNTNHTAVVVNSASVPRLLLPKYLGHSSGTIYQLFLNNNSFERYPHLSHMGVMAIAYMSSIKTLFASVDVPTGLFSTPLDGSGIKYLFRQTHVDAIAVDGKEQLVFFVAMYHSRKPQKMTRMRATGKNITVIFEIKYPTYVKSMAIDTIRKRIFTAQNSVITAASYEGTDQKIIRKHYLMTVIAINAYENVLYYNEDRKVFQVSLDDGQYVMITKLPLRFRSLVYHEQRIYVTPWQKGSIGYLNQSNFTVLKHFNGTVDFICAIVT